VLSIEAKTWGICWNFESQYCLGSQFGRLSLLLYSLGSSKCFEVISSTTVDSMPIQLSCGHWWDVCRRRGENRV